ncbi:ROK family protein [Sphingomonas morindae]|uniref:ROK family protein n=1 Tax=Sphingomonas morindae TaxID=1541170 RepID=A0ABY4XCM8_9SPHN|nr:ROK family protein [Sphingomonas morindae]USI74662.1 ROK family protein [Sphingomonas morindae]
MALNPAASYAAGLSVMTDLMEMVVVDLAGRPVCSRRFPNSRMTPDTAAEQLRAFLHDAADREGVDLHRVQAISLAVAGFFVGAGTRLNPSSQLDAWALIDLQAPFEAAFGIPVTVENIANASAVGEQLLGLGRRFNSFAYVNVAAGFGGGIILDGRLWRGVHGNAGEFAAILDAPPNLETLREVLAAQGIETANVLDMIERFDMAWPGVDAWVAQSGDQFARLAQVVHATMDVEALVLGGRLPRALAEALAHQAGAGMAAMFPPPRRGLGLPQPQILAAEINASAAAIGAASIPLARRYYDPIAHLNQGKPLA